MPTDIRVAVIYYSATGTVRSLAEAMVEGARETGAEVRLLRATETAPAEAIASRPDWQANLAATDHLPAPTLDHLRWADAIAIGCPTRFGNLATPISSFLETTGGLWFSDELADKLVGGFTSVSTAHGGHESTLLALTHIFHHWGSIIVPAGYIGDTLRGAGNPYGVSAHASYGRAAPSAQELAAARAYGSRLATVAGRYAVSREVTA
ncbi:NAD(P)H:quinone oxidoreductase [Nonomuraea jiangxiensis]|uniref:NAD(P)H dehydrogenase (Quinone) n=1 Tax=Nonomuraea jiangxiensis TaxID=633440 RepID=A0A1G8Y125_9ACTN|nr:NAD(P)H:quinone oxidoreductase [Nonomuraea jiangxiensis]SDJ95730.1 NAD(P)H dehydrogenase (quinone) [Nonomuraea jiangxiensis]